MLRTTLLHVTDIHFRKTHYAFLSRFAERNHCGVVISGDLIAAGDRSTSVEEQMGWVSAWVRAAKFPLFICGGNHDIDSESDPMGEMRSDWLLKLARKGVVVDGQSGQFAGLEIACVPYLAEFGASYLGADILVHHEPPYGSATASGQMDGPQCGSEGVARYLRNMRHLPHRLLLCGHAHQPMRWYDRVNGTLCVNPGVDASSSTPRYALADIATGVVQISKDRAVAHF